MVARRRGRVYSSNASWGIAASAGDREGEKERKKRERKRVVGTYARMGDPRSYFRRGSLCIVRKMEMESAVICL